MFLIFRSHITGSVKKKGCTVSGQVYKVCKCEFSFAIALYCISTLFFVCVYV